ncbi:MAG: ABC transporter ATP-binding protein [Clostridiales bacterium]|nr:ABC transporter ATP-binding protein [Clostridiales bacterium]MDU1042424.1 ABC transporter ATP-binding protein [Clostridiales bacterium]
MKRTLYYLKKNKLGFILGPLFKMLEASFELFVPIVVSHIVDKGIKHGDFRYVVHMTIVMVVLAVIGFISAVLGQYFAAKQSASLATQMRRDLYKHIQTLSMADRTRFGDATLLTRLTSDINQVETAVNFLIRQLLRSPVVLIGAMIMAFTIDAKAATIFVITIPVISLIVFLIMRLTGPKYKETQSRLDEDTLILRENLTGIRVIRAFNRGDSEKDKFIIANKALNKAQKVAGRISGLMNPLTYAAINVAIIALLWVGGNRVDSGAISQGNVIALYNYMSQVLIELVKFANLIVMISKAIASSKRIEELLETRPSIVDGGEKEQTDLKSVPTEDAVTFKNVSYRYGDASGDALENIDFSAKKGETIGIIGGTGSGKSTLVNLIPRLIDASEGHVLINGMDAKDYKVDSLRSRIGTVLQKAVLFKGSIRDNIRFGKADASDEEIWKALEIAQAAEFVKEKPGQLDYMVSRGGGNLSGGQKQRLSVARGLVRKPEILILDDSASALDFATDARLRGAIAAMEDGPTLFIVSQRVASIMHADKILVMDNGRIIAEGSHDDLRKTCDLYDEICRVQFKDAQ